MNNLERILIPIIWRKEGKNVMIKGNFKEFETMKLQDVYSSNSKREKSALLWLLPGTYFYKFIVDGEEKIDEHQPVQNIKGILYNMLIVSNKKQKDNKNIPKTERGKNLLVYDTYSKKVTEFLNKLPLQKQINDDSYNTFSIKGENALQEIDDSIKKDTDQSIMQTGKKVIVYNIGKDYLIPMILKNINIDTIMLFYIDSNTSITVNKNDIYVQETASFEKCGNLCDLGIINELSVLRSLKINFLDGKRYMLIKDILLKFIPEKEKEYDKAKDINADYFQKIFLKDNNSKNKLLIIKKTSSISFNWNNDLSMLFYTPITDKNINIPITMKRIAIKSFNLLDHLNGRLFLQLIFPSKGEMKMVYNIIPFFPNKTFTNIFFDKSILFSEEAQKEKFVKLNSSVEKEINDSSFASLVNSNKYTNLLQNFCNYNSETINQIWGLLEEINSTSEFTNILQLLFLSYAISKEQKVSSLNQALIFYSNLIVILSIKYLFDIISIQLSSLSKKDSNYNSNENTFLYIFSSSNDDNNSLNEIILKKSTEIKQTKHVKNNILSSFLKKNFNENLIKFNKYIEDKEKRQIKHIEKCFPYSFIENFYGLTKKRLKEVIITNIEISFSILENSEMQARSFKQIWYNDVNSFDDNFFSQNESIAIFLHSNRLLDYSILYQNDYFCVLSYENFFHLFLPILKDIDDYYNPKANYSMKIVSFFTDLHSYQNITEKFNIQEKEKKIQIGYQTFEILIQLMKSVEEEKAIIIQKHLRTYNSFKKFRSMKVYVNKIQRAWRFYLYKKLKILSDDELKDYLIGKYRSKDPLLLKFIISSQKNNLAIIRENQNIRKQIKSMENRRKKHINKKDKPILNLSSFSSSKGNQVNARGSNLNNLTTRDNNNFYKGKTSSHLNKSLKSEFTNFSGNDLREIIDKKEKKDILILQEKIEVSRQKYKDLLELSSEYDKKMEFFVKLINSKEEIKEILSKNGVFFN